jgi:hypothetical protein
MRKVRSGASPRQPSRSISVRPTFSATSRKLQSAAPPARAITPRPLVACSRSRPERLSTASSMLPSAPKGSPCATKSKSRRPGRSARSCAASMPAMWPRTRQLCPGLQRASPVSRALPPKSSSAASSIWKDSPSRRPRPRAGNTGTSAVSTSPSASTSQGFTPFRVKVPRGLLSAGSSEASGQRKVFQLPVRFRRCAPGSRSTVPRTCAREPEGPCTMRVS